MTARGHWGSRFAFVLAAAGSAVGLGNIWKFPYITGVYGGGLFVSVYLVCILFVGIPVLMAEVMIGRATQKSPVGAFASLSAGASAWSLVGWMGVVSGLIILSYYSVVAGWSLHYVFLCATNSLSGMDSDAIANVFGSLYAHGALNVFWHLVVMSLTTSIVLGGVSGGIETSVKILMPALLILMSLLLVDAMFQKGFLPAVSFIFEPRLTELSAEGVLEALGHSFFTLSLGMGAMLTYGSYLREDDDVPSAAILIGGLDTFVALVACLVIFPIIFTFDLTSQGGPGLVFGTIPVALSQLPGGGILNFAFFTLLFFAALSSTISLLEVVTATVIDQFGWSRVRATIAVGLTITLLGIPSALSGSSAVFGDGWASVFGKNYFDSFDWVASNVLLPTGGLLIALYAGWVMPPQIRELEFKRGSRLDGLYPVWLGIIRYVSPAAIFVVLLFSLGLLEPLISSETSAQVPAMTKATDG
ncbi:MAG: sodium-dependent transporter [Myxococcota bacterium]